MLGTRFRRARSARAVLGGVSFETCPRCAKLLPVREPDTCLVCGQADAVSGMEAVDEEAAQVDLDSRVAELSDLISRHELQIGRQTRRLRELADAKEEVDADLNTASTQYDSAVLSSTLELENRRAALRQQLVDLRKLEALTERIDDYRQRAHELAGEFSRSLSELREERARAERDTENLEKLKSYFLDCLIRARVPGIYPTDFVTLPATTLEPEITSAEGGLTVTSFGNLSSGGKKTLFKCCFAIALHRLAVEVGAALPTLLIIDSPMKNISERENRRQYEGFHDMLYDLAQSELRETQIVLIDKEFLVPPEGFSRSFFARYMTPDEDENPPLITYHRGK